MNKHLKESTFWYYVARSILDRIKLQLPDSTEPMHRRAAELGLPVEWPPEKALLWAAVCRLYVISVQRNDAEDRAIFEAFRRGSAACFVPRDAFGQILSRILDNIAHPALPDRTPEDSIADTFAVGALEYTIPEDVADSRHREVLTALVTDQKIHSCALLAIAPDVDRFEQYTEQYAERRPNWFRRVFSNADDWLFEEKETNAELRRTPLSEEAKSRVVVAVRDIIDSGDLQIPPRNIHYPAPDRSEHIANIRVRGGGRPVEVGWSEGELRDGRPFRLECWAEDGITSLTYFMSTLGFEDVDDAFFARLLEEEGLLRFKTDQRYVGARKTMDSSGNEMWSINVVVGDEERTYVDDLLPLRSY